MKYLICFFLLMNFSYADNSKNNLKKASKKVEKRKGYCSPMDKMMNKCGKMNKEDKKVLKKIKKKKGYCSPLDKMMNKCGKKK